MKNMSLAPAAHLLAILAWFAMASFIAAQPRFDPIFLEAGRPSVTLRGTAGSNYVIESSSDLKRWAFLFSGHAANGQLDYLDVTNSKPSRFYRGREDTAPAAPRL